MAACFFQTGDKVYIISNSMSVFQAGFHTAKSYYNKSGDTLRYFIHDDGTVLARISRRHHQTVNNFYNSKEEANDHFKRMNAGRTFQTGKWVPEKQR